MQETERDEKAPSQRTPKIAVKTRKASSSARFALHFGVRTVFWLTVALALLMAGVVAATRFWVVPNADEFRPRVIEALSRLTKQRVAIGGLSADWNGWSPEFRIARLQILDERGRTLLELPEVETTLSWRSLLAFEPRLSSLTVRNPRVLVRRTTENQLTLAGIDVNLADTTPSDPVALEWLLRQRYVQIANGEIEWHDEWRNLAPLRLRDVNVRLINDGAHHRIGLSATPSAEVGSPIQFRSEFSGSNLRKISDWDGSAYLRVDYANVALLARYLPLPINIARGDGGLQAWFDFDDGRPIAVTLDLLVRDASVTIPSINSGTSSPSPSPSPSPQRAPSGEAANLAKPISPPKPDPITLQALSGRLSWREVPVASGQTLAALASPNAQTRAQQRWSLRDVALTTAKGERLTPLSAELKLDRSGERIEGGEFQAAKLDLGAATQLAEVFASLVPPALLTQLREARPSGGLEGLAARWAATEAGESRFDVEATLDRVAWQRAALPGVSGLSGRVKFSNREGSMQLGATARSALPAVVRQALAKKERGTAAKSESAAPFEPLVLDFGALFDAPLAFGAVSGKIEWKQLAKPVGATSSDPIGRAAWQVRTDGLTIDSDDAKGKFAGTWQSDELGPGVAKITGKFDRVATTSVHKYLPNAVGVSARTWVRTGVLDGVASDVNFSIEGPLWHFPFADGKLGKFEIVAPLKNVVLDYADGWPRAERIDGVANFRGASLVAEIKEATIAQGSIGATRVAIADMAHSPVVEIRGSVTGSLDNFFRFVEKSPVNRMLDRFTEGAKATGNARLSLALAIPVEHPEKAKVEGDLLFDGNAIDLGAELPPLEAVQGRLRFTEREVRAKDVAASAFGGSVAVNVNTDNGVIRVAATGTAELLRVRERYDYPLLDQLKGQANWTMEMQSAGLAGEPATLKLRGTIAAQALPIDAVFQAAAAPRDVSQPVAFSLVRTALAQGRDRIEFEMPSQLHAILERSAERGREARMVERAVVDLGAQKTQLPTRGYSVRGDVAKLDTDAALALLPALTGSNAKNVGGVKVETQSPDFVNVNLRADRAIVFSLVLNDASLRAQPSGQRWRLALRSKEASGVISIDSASDASGDIDAVSVRLQRFAWPSPVGDADRVAPPIAMSAASTSSKPAQSRWPKLDLLAESFVSENRDLGRLEIKAQPSANEWRVETVSLTNPDGTLRAKGRWQLAAPGTGPAANGQSSMEVALNWKDAGKFMHRFGLPKGVDRGEGELTGEISWPGSPAGFAYARLGGKFTLKTGAGRFSEMEPGIAKLLGIISLQSLPRRLSFNFDDLFGRGFAFDSIAAEVSINAGKAATEAFEIAGPAARVDIRGSADLEAETAQLRVRVFPSISVATAIGVGLATANPAIGAAAWLGQKIARDPVERLLMQEFDVTGPWATPEVKQRRAVNASGNESLTGTPGVN